MYFVNTLLIQVTLDSGKEVNLGDAIRVKDLKVQPVIQWPHNATTYYSLVITGNYEM